MGICLMGTGYQAIPELQQQQQSPLIAFRLIGTKIDAVLVAWLKLISRSICASKADCSGVFRRRSGRGEVRSDASRAAFPSSHKPMRHLGSLQVSQNEQG
ncbi:hypothetical protein WG901_23670 [Novosphingobium sp. PS1R-30]|uniref:Transposase DDE domain-containing protein n=1 Tax=Novosphingobium anseongense TaxID=3133436 RepID=A0ABU8S3Y0_9SPHN